MKKLHAALEEMIRGNWVLSSSDEPGEGEHKIMAAWRSGRYTGPCAVYGLDADLHSGNIVGWVMIQLIGSNMIFNFVFMFAQALDGAKHMVRRICMKLRERETVKVRPKISADK